MQSANIEKPITTKAAAHIPFIYSYISYEISFCEGEHWGNYSSNHEQISGSVTPAIQANLTDTVWSWETIVAKMDEIAPKAGRPKTYQKYGLEKPTLED